MTEDQYLDHMAGLAMTALLRSTIVERDRMCREAYEIADAMLEEKRRRKEAELDEMVGGDGQ